MRVALHFEINVTDACLGSKRHASVSTPLKPQPWFCACREYALLENEYRNGESQRGLLVSTSRKRWRLGKRLTPAPHLVRSFLPSSTRMQPFWAAGYRLWPACGAAACPDLR